MKFPILTQFTKLNKNLKKKIKGTYLFGSRARRNQRPDSDYDLLLIVNNNFSLSDKDALYDQMINILIKTGEVLSLKIFSEEEYSKMLTLETPFMRNFLRDRVQIG